MSRRERGSKRSTNGRFGDYQTNPIYSRDIRANGSMPIVPSLSQSSTPSSKPSIASVLHRISGKMKSKRRSQSQITVNPQTHDTQVIVKNKSISTELNQQITISRHIDRHIDCKVSKPKSKSTKTVCSWFESAESMMKSKGYRPLQKVADTLQGAVYRCQSLNHQSTSSVIIKVTAKRLHSEGITLCVDGQRGEVQEDILKERDLLRRIGNYNSSHYFLQFVDFLETPSAFLLVEEDAGERDLFWWTVKCHELIVSGRMKRREWRLISKSIFRQLVAALDELHGVHRVCHLDVSLENVVLKNAVFLEDVSTGNVTMRRDMNVKLIDFGLAERFDDGNFICTKFVGKTRYKSPELWRKRPFDARLNDIWSLGISLFIMIVGAPPVKFPDVAKDHNMKLLLEGKLLQVIQRWNRAKFMTPQILDLLSGMLRREKDRISIDGIKRHSWVKLIDDANRVKLVDEKNGMQRDS